MKVLILGLDLSEALGNCLICLEVEPALHMTFILYILLGLKYLNFQLKITFFYQFYLKINVNNK